ncbi:MAG: transcriptional repressor LexA [Limnochordaceae bacterium]|nr:transcriptional repressor LexA [Limnochordaceae bacterium]
MAPSRELTPRQRQVLEFIRKMVQSRGYPPSVREIGEAVGLSSSSTVHGHLARLEEKGYLRRDPTKPRAIEILDDHRPVRKEIVQVPVLGRVPAGQPLLAVQNVEDFFPLPADFTEHAEVFMLRVRGDSMKGAGILDGDYVVVRSQPSVENGEIAVALVEDEATVKRIFKEKGQVRLQPENPRYKPILTKDVQILGKVIGVLRKLG